MGISKNNYGGRAKTSTIILSILVVLVISSQPFYSEYHKECLPST